MTAREAPNARRELEDTAEDLARKTREGYGWIVKGLRDHEGSADAAEFQVEWQADYAPTWEPRGNFPEELIYLYLKRCRSTDRKKAAGW